MVDSVFAYLFLVYALPGKSFLVNMKKIFDFLFQNLKEIIISFPDLKIFLTVQFSTC